MQALVAKLKALPAPEGKGGADAEAIQNEVFEVGKDAGFEPLRAWFSALYEVLLGQSQGPRFGSFVAIFGVDRTLALMEERIVQRLNTIAMGYCPFKVELKDFGSFPSHTIYINVTSKLPIRGLVNEIKDIQRLMKLDKDHKPHFIDDPYLTIARKLLPWQYEKGWLEYSNKSFTGKFIADAMLLLKRREGDRAWQIAGRFAFQNLPVSIRQGELFA